MDEKEFTNRDMLLALQKISFTGTITIEYSGGGDSGQIDDVLVEDVLVTIDWLKNNTPPAEVAAVFAYQSDKEPISWWTAIERWANNMTNDLGYDWYNNEGGGGTITIEPQSGRIEIDGYYNEITRTEADVPDMSMSEDDDAFTHDHGAASVLDPTSEVASG